MAKLGFNGCDSIAASVEQLAQISDEEKLRVLQPASEVIVRHQKEKIAGTFTEHTGALSQSITAEAKSGEAVIVITQKGKHPGSSTGSRKYKGRKKGSYSGTNAEIAYILNYGSPRIPATHWLENANEEAEEEVDAALEAAWDELLKSKGL